MLLFWLLLFVLFITVNGSPTLPCNKPLGLSDGAVKDSNLLASSSFSSLVGAHNGRLGTERGGGAWCPAELVSPGVDEWLEVSLGSEQNVAGVVIQGRYAKGHGLEFAKFVKVLTLQEDNNWREERNKNGEVVMEGNNDTFSKKEIFLEEVVPTSRVRIVPVSKYPRMVCLRVEVLVCHKILEVETEGGEEIIDSGRPNAQIDKIKDQDLTEEYIKDTKVEENKRGEEINKVFMARITKEKVTEAKAEEDTNITRSILKRVNTRTEESNYFGLVVGMLVTVILVMVIMIILLLYKNYKHQEHYTFDYEDQSYSNYFKTKPLFSELNSARYSTQFDMQKQYANTEPIEHMYSIR